MRLVCEVWKWEELLLDCIEERNFTKIYQQLIAKYDKESYDFTIKCIKGKSVVVPYNESSND